MEGKAEETRIGVRGQLQRLVMPVKGIIKFMKFGTKIQHPPHFHNSREGKTGDSGESQDRWR
jgi:hypothetical protein